MTEVQREKLNQVKEILGEHFDAHVVAVLYDSEDENGETKEESVGWGWDGGRATALGLLEETAFAIKMRWDQEEE